MRISDWSSDVCSSDLGGLRLPGASKEAFRLRFSSPSKPKIPSKSDRPGAAEGRQAFPAGLKRGRRAASGGGPACFPRCKISPACFQACRSEEHTSELQSLMRISYAVSCLKKTKHTNKPQHEKHHLSR